MLTATTAWSQVPAPKNGKNYRIAYIARAQGDSFAAWLADVWPNAREYARPVGIGTAVTLITAGSVIFGELIPKRLALTNPEAIAATVAIPLSALATAAKPVVMALGAINRGVLRILGIKDDARGAITEEEIHMLVTESHEQGVIDDDEQAILGFRGQHLLHEILIEKAGSINPDGLVFLSCANIEEVNSVALD